MSFAAATVDVAEEGRRRGQENRMDQPMDCERQELCIAGAKPGQLAMRQHLVDHARSLNPRKTEQVPQANANH